MSLGLSASEPPTVCTLMIFRTQKQKIYVNLCKTSEYRCCKFSAGCICSDFRGGIELCFSFNLIRNTSLFLEKPSVVLMAITVLLHSSHLGVSGCTGIALAVGLPLSI